MPIATPEIYSEMIDRAKTGGFAFPAVNVTSSQTLNAALRGFAEAESDGIVQVSTGGAAYWSGASTKDMVAGSLGFAAFAREVAKNYGVNIALHTDHCPKDKLDGFVLPLLAASEAEVKAGRNPLFNSHMWDGSAETLQENLRIARELLERTAAAKMILEVEIGTVGGEEDGVENAINDKLYTTVEDALATIDALGAGENGRYITALTFGNVHGVYKPGGVKLRPEILKDIQAQVGAKIGKDNPFDLVFHGGSGSSDQEIADAVSYGVIKMNIDTDTQYAYTRPVADHMFTQLRRRAEGRRRSGQQEDSTIPASGAPPPKPAWQPASSRPPSSSAPPARPSKMSDEFRKNLMGPEPTLLPAETEVYAAAGRRPGSPGPGGEAPHVVAAVGRPGRGGVGRGPHHRFLRLLPRRLPPRPGLAAPQRLARRRPHPVGARAQPRLPARAVLAGPGLRGHRRGRGAGAHREVPERLRPRGQGSHRSASRPTALTSTAAGHLRREGPLHRLRRVVTCREGDRPPSCWLNSGL